MEYVTVQTHFPASHSKTIQMQTTRKIDRIYLNNFLIEYGLLTD